MPQLALLVDINDFVNFSINEQQFLMSYTCNNETSNGSLRNNNNAVLLRISSLSDINCLVQSLDSGLLRVQQCAAVTDKVNTFPHSAPPPSGLAY
jgi:hypothetical protein